MPRQFQQQTLKYENHEEEMAFLGQVIDLVSHGAPNEVVIEELMKRRNRLQDEQKPQVVDFNPQQEQRA